MIRSWYTTAVALCCCTLAACSGTFGGDTPDGPNAGSSGNSGSGNSGSGGYGGAATPVNPSGEEILPFTAVPPQAYLRKIKNLLVGLAPTDQEVQSVVGAASAEAQTAALEALIEGWIGLPEFQGKMLVFFRNVFQQSGFTPTEDFKMQLLENGGFDFGPFGFWGDDAFPKLVKNLEESFARTTLELVSSERPFTEVLTTQQFMMTTALKSLYVQIEMPNDQPFNFRFNDDTPTKEWKVNLSGSDIPLEATLDPNSPFYMTFDDEAPVMGAAGFRFGTNGDCKNDPLVAADDPTARVNVYGGPSSGSQSRTGGYAQLFQRLIGYTARWTFSANPECGEHQSKPYFTAEDLSDWQMVTIRPLSEGEARIEPYDLPRLRQATELGLALPRVGFYTTPAYLALWNTNDSNQHRVTANQTLLVALGQGLTAQNAIVPSSTVGLDAEHATEGSECYGCHKSLDPLREFWGNQFDFNDRNDFQPVGFGPSQGGGRPTTRGGTLAFGSVNASGSSMADLGNLLAQATDAALEPNVNRFALAMAQQLCFYADSAACAENDPEFRRVVRAFQDDGFNFKTLVRELMASPLVTGAATTTTFEQRNVVVSIARRDHLCSALSNRLGRPDLCALSLAFPFQSGFGPMGGSTASAVDVARATFRIAGSVAADAFSRGSEGSVTPSVPTLFYAAASELLCENISLQAVDAEDGSSPYASSDVPGAVAAMVQDILGYTASDPKAAEARTILQAHYDAAISSEAPPTDALRSTFSLACQSPSFLGMGL